MQPIVATATSKMLYAAMQAEAAGNEQRLQAAARALKASVRSERAAALQLCDFAAHLADPAAFDSSSEVQSGTSQEIWEGVKMGAAAAVVLGAATLALSAVGVEVAQALQAAAQKADGAPSGSSSSSSHAAPAQAADTVPVLLPWAVAFVLRAGRSHQP